MTRFWREGFWRTSTHGVEHWVEGHWVEREDWSRTSYPGDAQESIQDYLQSWRAAGSATACFINPNADCPVCGVPVFFYQNEHGSKVYFDELGPPWPKHGCTDQQFSRTNVFDPRNLHDVVFPCARDEDIVRLISGLNEAQDFDPEHAFSLKYGTGRWRAYLIARRLRIRSGTALILSNLERKQPSRLYLYWNRLPQALKEGSLVFEYRNWIAYFDHAQMAPCEIELQRLPGARAFLEELVGSENDRLSVAN